MNSMKVTQFESFMPDARDQAGQCWDDVKTTGTEAFARKIAEWMNTAAYYASREAYWHARALELTHVHLSVNDVLTKTNEDLIEWMKNEGIDPTEIAQRLRVNIAKIVDKFKEQHSVDNEI